MYLLVNQWRLGLASSWALSCEYHWAQFHTAYWAQGSFMCIHSGALGSEGTSNLGKCFLCWWQKCKKEKGNKWCLLRSGLGIGMGPLLPTFHSWPFSWKPIKPPPTSTKRMLLISQEVSKCLVPIVGPLFLKNKHHFNFWIIISLYFSIYQFPNMYYLNTIV